MIEKYVLEVDIDHETGEEHCTVLKTDGTTNMANWIEIVSAMYTHHSILEPLVDELNKIQNEYNNSEKYATKLWEENEELKEDNKSWMRTADRMNTIHQEDREYCEKVHKENEQLKYENENLKITIKARDALIKVCEKKFCELGFIITVDDNGYVIE